MTEIITIAKDMYTRFNGTGSHLLLFWISLIVLILWTRKNDKKITYFLIIYSTFWMFIYVCPLTAKVIMDYCIGSLVYWRMLWILPYILIIAYVATNIICDMKTKSKRRFALFSLTILIVATGTNIFSLRSIDPSVGAAKIPTELEVICEEILASTESKGEQAVAVFPDELSPFVRQYDASIHMPYGRNVPKDMPHPLHDVLYAESLDEQMLLDTLTEYQCNYLIIETERAGNILSNEYVLVNVIDAYSIYYIESAH